MEADKIRRFLGISPTAGFDLAQRWGKVTTRRCGRRGRRCLPTSGTISRKGSSEDSLWGSSGRSIRSALPRSRWSEIGILAGEGWKTNSPIHVSSDSSANL